MANRERLTAWVKANPWRWAILSGVALVAWGAMLFGLGAPLGIIVLVGVAFGALNGCVWRPGGPGPRWNEELRRRYPPRN